MEEKSRPKFDSGLLATASKALASKPPMSMPVEPSIIASSCFDASSSIAGQSLMLVKSGKSIENWGCAFVGSRSVSPPVVGIVVKVLGSRVPASKAGSSSGLLSHACGSNCARPSMEVKLEAGVDASDHWKSAAMDGGAGLAVLNVLAGDASSEMVSEMSPRFLASCFGLFLVAHLHF